MTKSTTSTSTARKKRARKTTAEAAGTDQLVVDDIRDAVSQFKRERIIAAAVDCFYVHGYSNTTLESVADQLNVTKPFIYAHFKSKNMLLAEICSRGIKVSLAALNRIVTAPGSAMERMTIFSRDFMMAVLENQKPVAIYFREIKNLDPQDRDAINELRRDFDHKLIGLLDEGVAAGEFVLNDTRLAAHAIGGIASWSYVWFRPDGPAPAQQVAEEMGRLMMAMLRPDPGAPWDSGRV
ncbi:TetR/AcrR family transcriptional regulator [Alcaligenaceae bacterium]|nr:TetR/AcrR family transcriptional regulator [Alcaligenaceae bacterium]